MNGKVVSVLALLTALSAAGAMIKVPAIIGSVGLDIFPALLAAALIGQRAGMVVGGIGHLLSALVGGFPLGIMHLLIAAEMAILVWLFGFLYRRNHKRSAAVFFILGNSIAAPIPFIFLMNLGFYIAIVPSLLVGSILNVIIAIIAIPRLSTVVNLNKKGE